MQSKRNIAARAGRWSARHRRAAILGWLAFVVLAFAAGNAIGTKHLGSTDTSRVGDSGRADAVLRSEFRRNSAEQVLVQARGDAPAADVRRGVADVVRRVRATGVATNIRSPYAAGNAGQLSHDGRSALVRLEIAGTAGGEHTDRVDPLLVATAAAARAHPSLRVAQFGDASVQKELDESIADDFKKAQTLSLPITLVILVLAFGALAAAGVPVLLALTAVLATLGLLAIPSQVAPVDSAVSEVVLLMGMAVGVDYALFYLRREREERAAGRDADAALEAAAATSGRSVLVSGLTVMTAMAGMYVTGDKTFESFATGGILVVAVAVVGSLTVLPAVLSTLGDKVMKGRVPILGRRREQGAGSQVWSAVLRPVMRHPAIAASLAAAVLVALTIPALGLKTGTSGVNGLPQDLAVTKALTRTQAVFPGGGTPAQVVVRAPSVDAPAVRGAIGRLRHVAIASGRFGEPATVDVSPRRTVAVLSLPIAVGKGTDGPSRAALATLRDRLIPETVGRLDGVTADVTGLTAQSKDFNDRMRSRAPLVFAFVLAVAFVLLLVTFRSLVIPLKAIVLNLLSVGAAYGVLVLVFQKGWFESLLGFQSTGAIESWLPLFIFVVLFGLSMDYQVLIVSRIREAYDGGMSTDEAVEHGIRSTAGVVTSAAAVMVAVFAIFGSLSALMLKEMGVGLAVAVLLDATIVRAVLLPATMKLLGDWNWYLPRRLEWLPRIRHHEATARPAGA